MCSTKHAFIIICCQIIQYIYIYTYIYNETKKLYLEFELYHRKDDTQELMAMWNIDMQ